MLDTWTERRLKIEDWQRRIATETTTINLDSMRSQFDSVHKNLEQRLREVMQYKLVFWDGNDTAHLEDPLLSSQQWNTIAEYNSNKG